MSFGGTNTVNGKFNLHKIGTALYKTSAKPSSKVIEI